MAAKRAEAKEDELLLRRANGLESFPIKSALYRVWRDQEANVTRVVFSLTTKKATATLDDTRERHARPTWELAWSGKKEPEKVLYPRARLTLPSGYDDATDTYLTMFLYAGHGTTEKNVIEILEVGDKTVRARLRGAPTDANAYEGSGVMMLAEVVTTFRFKRSLVADLG